MAIVQSDLDILLSQAGSPEAQKVIFTKYMVLICCRSVRVNEVITD